MSVARSRNWVASTGQGWKIYVFLSLMVVAALGLVGVIVFSQQPVVTGSPSASHAVACALTAAGAVPAAFLWLGVWLRCSKCNASVGWHVVRTSPAGEWWVMLATLVECPVCGGRRT